MFLWLWPLGHGALVQQPPHTEMVSYGLVGGPPSVALLVHPSCQPRGSGQALTTQGGKSLFIPPRMPASASLRNSG